MPKRILYAICFALLINSFSAVKSFAQRDTIELCNSPAYYAITMQKDRQVAEKIMKALQPYIGQKSKGELMVMAAKMLLGTPYVASTLEEGEEEDVRIYLTKTDCILFVESCMNLVLTVEQYGSSANFEKFAQAIRQSRYRNGVVENYSDRIHYTTEWIRQGEKRGIVEDLTISIGGVEYNHPIYFMSKNPNLYKQLKDAQLERADCCGEDKSEQPQERSLLNRATKDYLKIAQVEKELNSRPFSYIPASKIASCQKQIKDGDIICFMATTEGLDIAHVAMAYWQGGKLGFIHASMAEKKVVIDKLSIGDYVAARKNVNGIKVVRVK